MPNWMGVALFQGFTRNQALLSYAAFAGMIVGLVLTVNGHVYGVFLLAASVLVSIGVSFRGQRTAT